MSANQADAKSTLSVRAMCRALKVSPSGYYVWQRRAPSARSRADRVLTEVIRKAHRDSDETSGMPRILAELWALGWRLSRKRVARLMRQACIRGVMPPAQLHGDHRAEPPAALGARFGQPPVPRRWA